MVRSVYDEKTLFEKIGRGEVKPRGVFGARLFELSDDCIVKTCGVLPEIQDVDKELEDIEVVEDHQKLVELCRGNRLIQVPESIVKVYEMRSIKFVRIADFSQYCRYALVPKLPTIRVGHGIYVALEAIRASVKKPYAVITV
jgi:hypothetical protein